MFKRVLVLLLCAMMLPCTVLAEGGILPALPSTDALCFGQVVNVQPAMAFLLTDSWYEAYMDVTPEQYYAFSTALAEEGFALTESTVDQLQVTAKVQRSDTEMAIQYIPASSLLTVTYALGRPTTPETIPSLEVLDAFLSCMLMGQSAALTPGELARTKVQAFLYLAESIQPLSPETQALLEQLVNAYPDYLR